MNGVTSFNMVTAGNEPSCAFQVLFTPSRQSKLNIDANSNGLFKYKSRFFDAESIDNRVFDMLGRQVYVLKKNNAVLNQEKYLHH